MNRTQRGSLLLALGLAALFGLPSGSRAQDHTDTVAGVWQISYVKTAPGLDAALQMLIACGQEISQRRG